MSHPIATDAPAVRAEVEDFLRRSRYMERGAVITDLDGTAVHEENGRVTIPAQVEYGLKSVHDSGRQVVINTLRFPRSVLSVFAKEWHRIVAGPIPLVSLKGSQVGQVVPAADGELVFEEMAASPLEEAELNELMQGIEGMVRQGANDLLVFFYPRDWRIGELIWTPDPSRVAAVQEKYLSASEVFSGTPDLLRERLFAGDQCLVFLLHDIPADRRMAYQHTERSRFVTHKGVDKRHGSEAIARVLGIDLLHSVGAGDAEPDNFLDSVGLAVIVGNADLDYKGRLATLRLPDTLAWGQVLFELGSWRA
jgi:hydroxymethylpyrimidine pyrophosphatase-like HAD family hydrolase